MFTCLCNKFKVTSTTIFNYIGRKLHENVTFVEFDHHLNFVFDDFLTDIIPRLQSYGYQRPNELFSDKIATNLMRQ